MHHVTGISSANQQAQVQSRIATAVARTSLNAVEKQGQAMVSLLSAARETQQQIQSQEPGKGLQVDVRG